MTRPSPPRPALRALWILASIAPALPGCASTRLTPPILAALDCAALIPPSYRSPVAPTPLPRLDATAGDLWSALDGQTTQLDQANGRAADLVAIADGCQSRQQAVLQALTPAPWYQSLAHRLFGRKAAAGAPAAAP